MIEYGQFKFVGENMSMGFETGRVYNLRLTTTAGQIKIEASGNEELYCLYSSVRNFMKNWEIVIN